jgi:hypothetical protein
VAEEQAELDGVTLHQALQVLCAAGWFACGWLAGWLAGWLVVQPRGGGANLLGLGREGGGVQRGATLPLGILVLDAASGSTAK